MNWFPTKVWEPTSYRVNDDGTTTNLWSSRKLKVSDTRRRRLMLNWLSPDNPRELRDEARRELGTR